MSQTGPRRRPAAGGYARGDEKRVRIIDAALRRFGEDGYEGASTRQIALDAGVNPPALQYYFDSKEGLYLACGEHILQSFKAAMAKPYSLAARMDGAEPAAALDVLCKLMDAVATFLFETGEAGGWSRFMARIHNRDGAGPVDQTIGQLMEDELHGHCTRLVGLVIGRPPADRVTQLRTMAVMGQLSAFHIGHEAALRRLGWTDLRGPRLGLLKRTLRSQTRAALGYPLT